MSSSQLTNSLHHFSGRGSIPQPPTRGSHGKLWTFPSLLFIDLIPSGKLTVCYWKWPSRNSGFSHSKWWVSFHRFWYVYQRVNIHFPMVFPLPRSPRCPRRPNCSMAGLGLVAFFEAYVLVRGSSTWCAVLLGGVHLGGFSGGLPSGKP